MQLEGSDSLPADDSASLGLNTPPALTIALVTETPTEPDPVFDALTRALAAIPNLSSQIISPDEYLPGSAFDLVIFNHFLPPEKPTSNSLILNLPGDTNPLDPTRLLLQSHPFLTSLDFTGLRNLHSVTFTLPAWLTDYPLQTVLEAEGHPLLQHGQTGQTQTAILSIDLTTGNLTQHPAFIILLNNLLTYYRTLAIPDQLPLGAPLYFPTGTGAELLTPNGETIPLASPCPCTFPDTQTPGLYRLTLIDPGGSAQTSWIGVNAGTLPESNIAPNQWSVTHELLSVPSTLEEPIQLAPYLLALVIVLLFLEAYLSWK
ncbi:MAG: hypothetical protein Fur0022_40490 [Anaerolineales bacterium]